MSSLPRYRGPIDSVEHAFLAGMVLNIRRRRLRLAWASVLCLGRPQAKTLSLHKNVGGAAVAGEAKITMSARREGEHWDRGNAYRQNTEPEVPVQQI